MASRVLALVGICTFACLAVVPTAFSFLSAPQPPRSSALRGTSVAGPSPALAEIEDAAEETPLLGITALAVCLGLLVGFMSAQQPAEARPWPVEPDGMISFNSMKHNKAITDNQRQMIRAAVFEDTVKEATRDAELKRVARENISEESIKARVEKTLQEEREYAKVVEFPA